MSQSINIWWDNEEVAEDNKDIRHARCPRWTIAHWDPNIFQSWRTLPNLAWQNISFRMYGPEQRTEALRLFIRLNEYSHHNILKCIMLKEDDEDNKVIIFFERIASSFHTWLDKMDKQKLWLTAPKQVVVREERVVAGMEQGVAEEEQGVVGGTPLFLKVFRGIIAGLDAFFAHDGYHGNLFNGVVVAEDGDVRLLWPVERECIFNGMKTDIGDLGRLVRKAAKLFKNEQGLHVAYHLFENLITFLLPSVQSFEALREFWFFVKFNPLFYGGEERYNFVRKMEDIKNDPLIKYKNWVKLRSYPTCMLGWKKRIPEDHKFHDILLGRAGRKGQFVGLPPKDIHSWEFGDMDRWETSQVVAKMEDYQRDDMMTLSRYEDPETNQLKQNWNEHVLYDDNEGGWTLQRFHLASYEHLKELTEYVPWDEVHNNLFSLFPDFVPKVFYEFYMKYLKRDDNDRMEIRRLLLKGPYKMQIQ